jgi:PEP-CTERM motif
MRHAGAPFANGPVCGGSMYVRRVLLLACLLASSRLIYADSFTLKGTSEIPQLNLHGNLDNSKPDTPKIEADDVRPFKWDYEPSAFRRNGSGHVFRALDDDPLFVWDEGSWIKRGKGPSWLRTGDRTSVPALLPDVEHSFGVGVVNPIQMPSFNSGWTENVSANPEPSTLLLLGTGLLLVGLKWKKNPKRAISKRR